MNFSRIKVLVFDGFGRQIPGMLQMLHDINCDITTVNASKLDPGYASKYPQHKIVVEGIKDDNNILYQAIEKELTSDKYDVVIPITEKTTDYILKNIGRMGCHTKVASAPLEAFEQAYDKEKTLIACEKSGVPCPLTRMDSETVQQYIARAKFPLALKPRKGAGSIGFRKVETADELMKLIDDGLVNPEQYVIQEFIPQTDIQYVCYMFVDQYHEVKFSMTAAKLRWFPIDGGSMCLGQAVERPDLIEYSTCLLKEINWSGFCQVGYINDPRDNVPKILEINGRIPASVKLCYLCGGNIMQQLIEFALEDDVTRFDSSIRNGIKLRYFQTDLLWFIKSKNRFKTKPSWFNNRNTKDYIFSIKDPWPFFSYSLRGMLRYDKEMEKRKR